MNLRRRMYLWTGILPLVIALSACGGSPDTPPEAAAPADSAMPAEPSTRAADRPKLNLNTATREAFLTIPNVGDNMVAEFFEYRPYVSIQQFRREIGKYVDEEQVAAYEQYVYVPVDPNESDALTLQQLPGVDGTEAEELIAGRPYASTDAFIEALGAYITGEQQAAAEAYLAMP